MKSKIDSYVEKQTILCARNDSISPRLFEEYGVYRGLRDEKGNGVLTGLTGISDIVSSRIVEGEKQPCDGELWYRGYEIKSLISGLGNEEFGFEKVAYLLLFCQLPKEEELSEFEEIIGQSPRSSCEFYQGCHHESGQFGYHEYDDQEYPDAGLL